MVANLLLHLATLVARLRVEQPSISSVAGVNSSSSAEGLLTLPAISWAESPLTACRSETKSVQPQKGGQGRRMKRRRARGAYAHDLINLRWNDESKVRVASGQAN